MIRLLRLFVWLGLRESLNRLKFARRTDQAEQFSRLLGVAVPALLGIILVVAMAALAGLGYRAGLVIGGAGGEGGVATGGIELSIQLFILVALATMALLIPVGISEGGRAVSSSRFLLLPVSRRQLHLTEVLSGMGNLWVLLLLAGCLLLPLGILHAGRPGVAAVALGAGLALIALAVTYGGLLGFATQWLFRDRGRGELIILVLMGALLLFSALAPFMEQVEVEPGSSPDAGREVMDRLLGSDRPETPAWMAPLPPGLFMGAIRSAASGRPLGAAGAVAALLVQAALLFRLSARAHSALMDRGSGGSRRKVSSKSYQLPALPGVPPQVQAVAQAQVRTALRTVRGKVAVLFAGGFILVQAAVLRGVPEVEFLARFFLDDGSALAVGASLLALVSLQPFMFNQFASDGEGLAMQYLAPVSDRELIMGKALGMGLLLTLAMVPCLVATIVLAPGTGVLRWLSVPFSILSVYALLAPLAAFTSMVFPKTADLSKMSYAGNAHIVAGTIGFLATAVAAAPPVLINGFIGTVLGSQGIAFGLIVAWSALCAALSIPLLTGASRLAGERRENLGMVARGQ